ncbi:MAG TPA: hypothetical protein VHN80_03770, partial [Kineosporiaceae bacterium]|nr:hypothetical protein [Kineosporiaceae bacterium]
MPSTRRISVAVRRRSDLPDTVSHEAVGMMLRGSTLVRWAKLESVVRLLAESSVAGDQDVDAVVRRFHRLWLRASDDAARRGLPSPALVPPPTSSPPQPPRPPPALSPSATPAGIALGFVDVRSPPPTPASGVASGRRRAVSLLER